MRKIKTIVAIIDGKKKVFEGGAYEAAKYFDRTPITIRNWIYGFGCPKNIKIYFSDDYSE